jgi:hypothetical protein
MHVGCGAQALLAVAAALFTAAAVQLTASDADARAAEVEDAHIGAQGAARARHMWRPWVMYPIHRSLVGPLSSLLITWMMQTCAPAMGVNRHWPLQHCSKSDHVR